MGEAKRRGSYDERKNQVERDFKTGRDTFWLIVLAGVSIIGLVILEIII